MRNLYISQLSRLFFIITVFSCSNPSEKDDQSKINETNRKSDSTYYEQDIYPKIQDEYSNPSINFDGHQFISNQVTVSDLNTGEKEEIENKEDIFNFGRTADGLNESVLVVNYTSEPTTYFIDSIKDEPSKHLLSMTFYYVHRRRLQPDGTGYSLEKYVVLEQRMTEGGIIMIQIVKDKSRRLFSYANRQ